MSCTNFKAPLIQRMYSLAVKRQSKASYRGLLDLLAVHFKGRENKDIANIWCNILRTAFSWKNQSDTNGFFHTTFSLVDIPSVTFLYQTSPVYPKHFFPQRSNCIFTGHWKCSQVRSVQKRLSATYKRKKGKSYHEYSQESKPEWMQVNYQRSLWSLLCWYTGLITIAFWLLENKSVINSTITIIY